MDCSATEAGWFELKAYVTTSNSGWWEGSFTPTSECSGDIGGTRPYSSGNHMARCGFVNVFTYQNGGCTVNSQ